MAGVLCGLSIWTKATGLAVFGYVGITEFEGMLINTDPSWARLLIWLPLFGLLLRDALKMWDERVPPAKMNIAFPVW